MSGRFADVIIDISAEAVDRAFTYRIPEALSGEIRPGVRVEVPFGTAKKPRAGYVIGVREGTDFDEHRIKEISALAPAALRTEETMMRLALFLANEYGSTLNQALKTVLPVKRRVRKNSRRTNPVERTLLRGDAEMLPELNDCQQKICRRIEADMSGGAEVLSADAGNIGAAAAAAAEKADRKETDTDTEKTDAKETEARLREGAAKDSEMPRTQIPELIYGVTGSGKTLIYIALIEYARKMGKQSIVLIPEISLTYQTVRRLSAYFGERVAVLHSRLSEGERYEQYQKAADGEIDVMVGPRSAVFAPFANLGLIVIDEEHERAYHSDTTPRYDVREVALLRAKLAGAKVVLGSATPSLESYTRALSGQYRLHVMKQRAAEGAELPDVHIADLRKELAEGNRSIFSRKLYERMQERLSAGEQVMLFLNRRGYAGFVSCRSCGYVVKCAHCDVSMTAHNNWYYDKKTGRREAALLSCHYCGAAAPMPARCPACGSTYIAPFGTGTQKLEQAVRREFPNARVLRMDADTTAKKDAHEEILSAFARGDADILIGTQMIVKGHDFPRVTLVGIIAADLSLNAPEYDASERTFQLLTQAAGRAGRGARRGDVVIQSYDPSHYAIACAAAQDYEAFYEREMSYRKLMHYPPLEAMLGIRFQGRDEALLDEVSARAAEAVMQSAASSGAALIGPCRASLYKVNDSFRKILYIKHESHAIILRIRDELRRFVQTAYPNEKIYLSYELRR